MFPTPGRGRFRPPPAADPPARAPSRRRPRPAFTLIELLAIIFIIVVALAIFLPMMEHTHRGESRVKCGSNLRQIGQAILLYSNENRGAYPAVAADPDAPPTWGTGAAAANPFTSPGRPRPNDVTAALWLLLRTQDIAPEVFVCPNTDAEKDTFGGGTNSAQTRSNFTDWTRDLSYSYANPYPNPAALKAGYALDAKTGSEFAVAADLNPGVGGDYDVTAPADETAPAPVLKRANSRNHQGTGQNVLFGDGHVEWHQNPFAGVRKDHIYTVSGSTDGSVPTSKTVAGSPTGPHDSVLLPPHP